MSTGDSVPSIMWQPSVGELYDNHVVAEAGGIVHFVVEGDS